MGSLCLGSCSVGLRGGGGGGVVVVVVTDEGRRETGHSSRDRRGRDDPVALLRATPAHQRLLRTVEGPRRVRQRVQVAMAAVRPERAQGEFIVLRVSWYEKTNEWVLNKAGVKRELLDTRQSKEASVLWSHHEETRKLPGEKDNAGNNARCTQARKTTHGLDGQHQDVNRTLRGRASQNDRGQG